MSVKEKTNPFDDLKSFPKKIGIYIFKDIDGTIIYIGKAKVIRDRLRSYASRNDSRAHIRFLIRRIKSVDYIVTDTEKEALLLENTLIKKHKPRYNFQLRDDKTYVSIRLGMEHDFPRISIVRRSKKDGALYFGPYDSAKSARKAVDYITRFLGLRSCSDGQFKNRMRPCIKHDIGRCLAPCVGECSAAEYMKVVDSARMFLLGRSKELISVLKEKMKAASVDMRYEDAAKFRDGINTLKSIAEGQKSIIHTGGNYDAIAVYRDGVVVSICVLSIRGGKLLSKKLANWPYSAEDDEKLMFRFIIQHYLDASDIPDKLYVSVKPNDIDVLYQIMNDKYNLTPPISVPSRGIARRMVELARKNAFEAIDKSKLNPFVHLGKIFGLESLLKIVECVDISNLNGTNAVGSLVRFTDGQPDKGGYRIYNIRCEAYPDDYAMMYEVLKRRFSGDDKENLPDLLLVDGGKGHLAVAERVACELSVEIKIASIAKAGKMEKSDKVFIPMRKNPISLKRGSKELLFLMRVRDEAHRFGVFAHRKRRDKL